MRPPGWLVQQWLVLNPATGGSTALVYSTVMVSVGNAKPDTYRYPPMALLPMASMAAWPHASLARAECRDGTLDRVRKQRVGMADYLPSGQTGPVPHCECS